LDSCRAIGKNSRNPAMTIEDKQRLDRILEVESNIGSFALMRRR
jgi:hypothetical protein